MSTSLDIDRLEKTIIAANFNVDSIESVAIMIKPLLLQRKKLSKRLLKHTDTLQNEEYLRQSIDYLNDQICKLLGI